MLNLEYFIRSQGSIAKREVLDFNEVGFSQWRKASFLNFTCGVIGFTCPRGGFTYGARLGTCSKS